MDIVEQCRKAKEYSIFDADVYEQAADEIERLQRRVELLEGYLKEALWLVKRRTPENVTGVCKELEGKE